MLSWDVEGKGERRRVHQPKQHPMHPLLATSALCDCWYTTCGGGPAGYCKIASHHLIADDDSSVQDLPSTT